MRWPSGRLHGLLCKGAAERADRLDAAALRTQRKIVKANKQAATLSPTNLVLNERRAQYQSVLQSLVESKTRQLGSGTSRKDRRLPSVQTQRSPGDTSLFRWFLGRFMCKSMCRTASNNGELWELTGLAVGAGGSGGYTYWLACNSSLLFRGSIQGITC